MRGRREQDQPAFIRIQSLVNKVMYHADFLENNARTGMKRVFKHVQSFHPGDIIRSYRYKWIYVLFLIQTYVVTPH